jgi:hypothetical protein
MRTFLLVTALVAASATATASPYGKPDVKTTRSASVTADASGEQVATAPLNNVVRVAADGKRTALCCCGHEFAVTDKSPTMSHDGTSFFMCGEACKAAALAATPQEAAKTMAEWRAKFDKAPLATNAVSAGGKTTAVCGCGAAFTVTDRSPVIVENGVKLYCCGDACHEHLLKMSAGDRMALETKSAGAGRQAAAGM